MKKFTYALISALSLATASLHAGTDSKDMKETAVTQPIDASDAGFYVSAYGGAQFATDYGNERNTASLRGSNVDIPLSGGVHDSWGGAGGLKFGYNFQSFDITDGFKLQPAVEAEALYLGTDSTYNAQHNALTNSFVDKTSYNSAAGFINGIVRFKLNSPFSPYFGLGVGGQYLTTHRQITLPAGNVVSGLTGSDVDFAAQALIGVDYKITPHWSVFTEYKFIDALGTDIKYSNVQNSGVDGRFKPDQIQQHLAVAGVKYSF